jgi:hypothetical protein
MSDKSDYDWASAIAAVVSTESNDFTEIAKAAELDPLNGDFSDADFSGLDLSNQNLSGWDLRNAKFTNAHLTNTELRNARINPNEIIEAVNWEAAKLDNDVLEAARHAALKRSGSFDRLIDNLELSVRSTNVLRNDKIEYVGELVQRSESQILRMPNGGRKSLNEIKESLAQLGLYLGIELGNWVPPNQRKA